VAHVRWSGTLERVLIEDVRGNNMFLRVTLHQDAGVIVVSHWRGDECVAATRIPLAAAAELADLFEHARQGDAPVV
jgi:hypothetical protein